MSSFKCWFPNRKGTCPSIYIYVSIRNWFARATGTFPFWMPPFLWGRSGLCSVGIFCHSWVLREHSVPTQSTLRACSVVSHVHPELLTPLYSMQVVWFSINFTILKYPCLTLVPIVSVSYKPSSSPDPGLELMDRVYRLNSTHESWTCESNSAWLTNHRPGGERSYD